MSESEKPSIGPPQRGWVLYDGDCGFCSRWVPYWKNTLAKYGFEIAKLQEAWVSQKLGISEAELLKDIRVLMPDGQQFTGADAYRFIFKSISWTKLLYYLTLIPPFKQIFEFVYKKVAQNRHCISRACGL